MATIIQDYGPIYGEVVNGTVQGRPNGSVYVPSSNIINARLLRAGLRIRNSNTNTLYICNNSGQSVAKSVIAVAEAQDLASYIRYEVGTTNEFTTSAHRDMTSGQFNIETSIVAHVSPDDFTIIADETYYVRALLVASTNDVVAVSEILEVTGWASS